MDQFAYDQETQGRGNLGVGAPDLGEFGGFGSAQQIVDYFNTPGLTPLQGVQTMMQYGIEPEDIASILGLTPEAARSQYNAALAPFAQATAPVTTTPVTTAPTLSAVERILVDTYGYRDNGDGTLTDANGAIYDTEQGGFVTTVAPAVTAPTTTTTTAAPAVRTVDDDIRDFFATNPTAQETFDAMQANNISPQDIIRVMGLDPAEAMAEYNKFLNPANAPAPTPTGGAAASTTATGPGTAATAPTSTAYKDMTLEELEEALANIPGAIQQEAFIRGEIDADFNNDGEVSEAEQQRYDDIIESSFKGQREVQQQQTDILAEIASRGESGGFLGGLGDTVSGAASAVGKVIDAGLIKFGDLIGLGDPALVVLNPTAPSGTVIFGKPSGNAQPVIIGNMPTSGAPIGVFTGVPILDKILSEVFTKKYPGQSGGGWWEIIKDTALDEIAKATGYPIGAISAAMQGDIDKLASEAYKVVLGLNEQIEATDKKYTTQDAVNEAAKTPTPTPTPTTAPIDTDVTDPFPLEPGETTTSSETDDIIDLIGGADPNIGPQPNYSLQEILDYIESTAMQDGIITDEEAREIARTAVTNNVSPERIAAATGEDIDKVLSYFPGGSNYIDPTVTPRPTATPEPTTTPRPTATPEPTTTPRPTATPEPTTTPRPTATPEPTTTPRPTATPEPTPTAAPDGPVTPPKVVSPGSPNIPGVVTPTTPAPQQGMRVEGTEKAGLAEIDPQFELSASLLDNLLRILSSEDDNGTGVPYYRGGKVAPYADIDEIIRLLRG
jgi:hypothetical protein